MEEITIGMTVVDTVTGFKGTAVGIAKYMSGVTTICIQPNGLTDKGQSVETEWYDSKRVTEVAK